jgi:hypothetical protein
MVGAGDGFGSISASRSGSGMGALNGSYYWLSEHLSVSRQPLGLAEIIYEKVRETRRDEVKLERTYLLRRELKLERTYLLRRELDSSLK